MNIHKRKDCIRYQVNPTEEFFKKNLRAGVPVGQYFPGGQI